MAEFNKLQMVKRRFFAMRNGVVADAMRRGGSKFRIIFGLNLPQIAEIASGLGYDKDLAWQLWGNRTTRESMLLAPMLFDPAGLQGGDIERLCDETPDIEVADVLCHRLLKRLPDAAHIMAVLSGSDVAMKRYIALRLAYWRVGCDPEASMSMACKELGRDEPLTANISRMLMAEAEMIMGDKE